MDELKNIGFYTLEDKRAINVSDKSPMWRCEIVLTDTCNFKCPYCRGLRTDCKGVMPIEKSKFVLSEWIKDGLKNIRFSGGEPLTYPHLVDLVKQAKEGKVEHIAISTNGSFPFSKYAKLVEAGVNDFSISLDACCSSDGEKMAGGIPGAWEKVIDNIRRLSKMTYVTVGIVFTEENIDKALDTIRFAHSLGVSDIRIISSAQFNKAIEKLDELEPEILDAHPILKYRVRHFREGRNVRGIKQEDNNRCHIVKDDSAVAGNYHFPCIIYMREHGKPIGKIGHNMRKERMEWSKNHNVFEDPICRKNCLDVCIDYNKRVEELR